MLDTGKYEKKKKMYLAFTVQPENMLKVVILTDPQNMFFVHFQFVFSIFLHFPVATGIGFQD